MNFVLAGCIRRPSDNINEDYDEIDRRFPPIFINNTRTKIVVASGKTATLECRVQNLEERTVSLQKVQIALGDFCNALIDTRACYLTNK